MSSTYYLAVHTQTDYGIEEYVDAAGQLAGLLTTILSNKERLTAMAGEFERAYTEVEVALEPGGVEGRELVGKAVVEFSEPVKFDKGKFSAAVKEAAGERWPEVKIAKRALA